MWDSQEVMALINETILGDSPVDSYGLAAHPLTADVAPVLNEGENAPLYEGNFTHVPAPYGGDYFMAFHKAYFPIHGYLAIVISIFGIVSNVINVAVLSQKSMVTPTNAILTALAVVDVLVMLTYVPFALHQFILRYTFTMVEWRSYSWMLFICFNINFTIVCHTISVWLTITLAVFRYIAVSFPNKVQEYCSMRRAILAIVSAFLCTAIICTPSYLSVQVTQLTRADWTEDQLEQMDPVDQNTTMYRIDESDLSRNNNNIPRIISFYAFSVLAKLVPCVVLTLLSIQLVRALIQAERRRFQLKNPNGLPPRRPIPSNPATTGTTSNGQRGSLGPTETTQFLLPPGGTTTFTTKTSNNSPSHNRPVGRDRTTRMLLAILVFFLITEFPSGLVALFSCFSPDFFKYVYGPLGDLMDILALINSSVNFILYCSMSRQFRKTFCSMFVPKPITQRWKAYKVRRGNGTTGTALTERTVTYHPNNKQGSLNTSHTRTTDGRTVDQEDDMGT
ncbi:hypothetical protein RvY_07004 [Ramazzottius varieornatus]|uniref:G-protein coupled receptors family 1 profile domain-containing protein n=1 Tax=Ramazzottius varieornatus TaxID=947166 RepID=A0A1D1V0H6_RAMVA|nr:hypothetical protein RvY_07004 [Ramazzottius varieornatus]